MGSDRDAGHLVDLAPLAGHHALDLSEHGRTPADPGRTADLAVPVICADAGYCENAHFRAALTERDLDYVVQVKGTYTAPAADAVP